VQSVTCYDEPRFEVQPWQALVRQQRIYQFSEERMQHHLLQWIRPLVLSALVLGAWFAGMFIDEQNWAGAVRQAAGLEAAIAAPLTVVADAAPSTAPAVINYQGVVRDANGQLLANGEYHLTFRIYDSVAGLNPLWEEVHTGVTVRDGRFAATLGSLNAFTSELFTASPNRFVGVTVQDSAEMQPRLRLASVPYAIHAEDSFDGVPVGGVIDWWRPDASFPIPAGYQACDGSTVNDPASPLNGKASPDLRGRFIRGAQDAGAIGQIGGAESHAHSVTTSTQNLTTANDGTHSHPLSGVTGSISNAGPDPGAHSYFVRDDNSGWNNTKNNLAVGGNPPTTEGHHRHDLDGNGTASASGSAHQHNFTVPGQLVTSEAVSNLPPYYGLLKLCRIR
jgi:hypothetical protein